LRAVSHLFLLMIIVSAEALLLPTCFSFPQEGDWAVYSARALVLFVADANDEKVKEQIEYYENINNTVWNLTIQIVNYPNVTFSITKKFNNGTISLENYEGNVETGTPNMDRWIISSNLSVRDPIYRRASDEELRIEDRASHEFANATRDVLYASSNQSQSGFESYFGFFWDRETGILCGISSTLKYYGDDENNDLALIVMVNIDIVDTSLWMKTTPRNDESNWPVIITLIALVSILIVTLVLFRKRKKKRKMGLRK